jgi:hypothetical protein
MDPDKSRIPLTYHTQASRLLRRSREHQSKHMDRPGELATREVAEIGYRQCLCLESKINFLMRCTPQLSIKMFRALAFEPSDLYVRNMNSK